MFNGKLKLLLVTIFLFNSCSGFKEAGKVLRNEKTKTTDEFLVKKRDPLVLPPDFKKIPKPGNKTSSLETKEREKIKKILDIPNEVDENKNTNASSVEDSILNKINKWKQKTSHSTTQFQRT